MWRLERVLSRLFIRLLYKMKTPLLCLRPQDWLDQPDCLAEVGCQRADVGATVR